ncbi:MAG: methyltransferase [Pseudomonadota bacterium]|nr:methyltransferase [Pseudomonadota bacterium]
MLRNSAIGAALALALAACATASDSTSQASAAASAEQTPQERAEDALKRVIAGEWRSPENVERDNYRNPFDTLMFFGVEPQHTVVEVTPGAGWYSEILAPYLREDGHYVAAVVDPQALPEGSRDFFFRSRTALEEKFTASPAQYDRAQVVAYDPANPQMGPAGSADVVLTFRNVHNWRNYGQAEAMFKAFHDVLKPGGTLGVVEHRAASDVPVDDKSGYVGQAQLIALAQQAGFVPEGSSEINANPRDTKDHPKGVWMLPPANRHEEADAAKYQAIGESDRMTLRFRKPAA